MASSVTNNVPFILLLNKCDLADEQEISEDKLHELKSQGWKIIQTSAKDGTGVDEAFDALTKYIMEESNI